VNGVIPLGEAIRRLLTNPKPILCLDTCDFLDILRCFEERGNKQGEVGRRLLDVLIADPDRVQVVITELVRHEWGQNLEDAKRKAFGYLQEMEQRIERVINSCEHAQIVVVRPSIKLAQIPLVEGLIDLAERLMIQALILEKDFECIEKALARVMDKRRPSHRGEIKDSIHLEHYLEFSRRLSQTGFTEPRIFVSGNRSDFWDGPPQLHRDLRIEFDEVGLQFFGKLDAALGRLGI
jgi:hypothetical protein